MKLNKSDYVAKISTASPLGLVVITYELIMNYIEEAIETDDTDIFKASLKKAQGAVDSLVSALDMSQELSKNLISVYIYVNKLIINSYFGKDKKPLDDCLKILNNLYMGWLEAEKALKTAPSAESEQEIYAGLTYKNGVLEEYVKEKGDRGFFA